MLLLQTGTIPVYSGLLRTKQQCCDWTDYIGCGSLDIWGQLVDDKSRGWNGDDPEVHTGLMGQI